MDELPRLDPDFDLEDEVPGLGRAAEHIMLRMSIALDDLLGGIHEREWFEEEMRQTISYFAWLYIRSANLSRGAKPETRSEEESRRVEKPELES